MAETPYVETEVLLALLNSDRVHAIELVSDMSETERLALQAIAEQMVKLLDPEEWCAQCGRWTHPGDDGDNYPRIRWNRRWWHHPCYEQHTATQRIVKGATSTLKGRLLPG